MTDTFMPAPTEDQHKRNALQFYRRWNFPNCCMAIDGKHVRVFCPSNTGSLYFNYKEYYSVVLLALVDADCKFVAIDVGAYGGEGDAGVYTKSNFGKRIAAGSFNLPPPTVLPNTTILQPHVILGDSAFTLTENMMKPYPQTLSASDTTIATYNYRHCRARRTTENAFGIMCQYFRIYFTPIAVKNPETIDDIIFATCLLHNTLRDSKVPYPEENIHSNPTIPTETFRSLTPSQKRRPSFAARHVREVFKDYFNQNAGSVGWQNNIVNRINYHNEHPSQK